METPGVAINPGVTPVEELTAASVEVELPPPIPEVVPADVVSESLPQPQADNAVRRAEAAMK